MAGRYSVELYDSMAIGKPYRRVDPFDGHWGQAILKRVGRHTVPIGECLTVKLHARRASEDGYSAQSPTFGGDFTWERSQSSFIKVS